MNECTKASHLKSAAVLFPRNSNLLFLKQRQSVLYRQQLPSSVLVTSNEANMAASRLAWGRLWSRRVTSMVLTSLGAGRRGTTRVTWAPSTPSLATGLRSRPSLTVPGTCQLLSVPMLSVPMLSVHVLSVPVLSVPVLSVPMLSVPMLSVPMLSSGSHTAFTRGLIYRHTLLLVCLAFLSHAYRTFHACLPVPNAVPCMVLALSRELCTSNI